MDSMNSYPKPAGLNPRSRPPGWFWRALHPIQGVMLLNLVPRSFYSASFGCLRTGHNTKVWVLNAPEAIRHVMVTRAHEFVRERTATEALETILGQSMATSVGEIWRRKRRLAAPSFRRESVRSCMPIFAAAAEALAETWIASPGPVRVAEGFTRMNVAILGRSLIGEADAGDAGAISDILNQTVRFTAVAMMILRRAPQALRKPLMERLFRKPNAALTRLAGAIFVTRATKSGSVRRTDLLQQWVDAAHAEHDPLTPAEMRNELAAMIFAGNETSSRTLAWLFYLLSIAPAVRERLEGELDSVLQGRPPGPDDLERLPYTRAVIEETLRLYPPFDLLRTATTNDEIIPGVKPEPGDVVAILPYVLHRHTDYWTDPDCFRPERFLDDDKRRRPVFMPYGNGPRMCIAMAFADIQLLTVVATIAQRLRLNVRNSERVVVKPNPVLGPAAPLIADITPRGR